MYVKIVNAGACLRAVDKKGRTIANIPRNLTSTIAKRMIEEYAARVPYPAEPKAREAWVAALFSGG